MRLVILNAVRGTIAGSGQKNARQKWVSRGRVVAMYGNGSDGSQWPDESAEDFDERKAREDRWADDARGKHDEPLLSHTKQQRDKARDFQLVIPGDSVEAARQLAYDDSDAADLGPTIQRILKNLVGLLDEREPESCCSLDGSVIQPGEGETQ